ncbi:U2 snRNP-associated SURP domain-containing protein [Thoreauomyces humboldtii]|nr:U2 snRNP-associated SURP domain-containing protein [Thoreauomyces humboldtii]
MAGDKRQRRSPSPDGRDSKARSGGEKGRGKGSSAGKHKLPWGMEKPTPIKKITETKLQAFTVGINKRTPFQKAKEEAELRKKKENQEAAEVYAQFAASFDDDGSAGWVRGGSMQPKPVYDAEGYAPRSTQGLGASKSNYYKPQPFVKAGAAHSLQASAIGAPAFVKAGTTPQTSMSLMDQEETSIPTVPKALRKRNLDMFLEELKKGQEERDYRFKSKHVRTAEGHSSDMHRSDDMGSVTLRAGERGAVQAGRGLKPCFAAGALLSDCETETKKTDAVSKSTSSAFEENAGSHDTGDPTTTNLYVGNINPAVDERIICQEFGVFGPIASVKIMWPRTLEEEERRRNCGFVSFMTRRAASEALRNLDGKDLMGNILNVGWGKAVALPAQPLFELPGSSSMSAPAHRSKNPRPQAGSAHTYPLPSSSSGPRITVSKPNDRELVIRIHRLIERVIQHGPQFEAIIMQREHRNPAFAFLFQNDKPDHQYYRWKLFSILQGDASDTWHTDPFYMFDEETLWVPPDILFDDQIRDDEDPFELSGSESDSESEGHTAGREARTAISTTKKGPLLRAERYRLESMLRKLTLSRVHIGKAMVFCLDHASAADAIVQTLLTSLLIPTTPIFPTKCARLYLVSDILSNTNIPSPNVWKYRSGLETRLEEVFRHFGDVRRGVARRLRREEFRNCVCNVLDVWDAWIVFPTEFLKGLRDAFLDDPADKERKEEDAREDASQGEDASAPHPINAGESNKWTVVGSKQPAESALPSTARNAGAPVSQPLRHNPTPDALPKHQPIDSPAALIPRTAPFQQTNATHEVQPPPRTGVAAQPSVVQPDSDEDIFGGE